MRRPRKTCGDCPKWQRGVCVAYAKIMLAAHPACSWGRRQMYLDYLRGYYAAHKEKNHEND